MKQFFLFLLPALLAAVALVGCHVHQWPEPREADEPLLPELPKVTMPLRLVYEPDFYVWEHKYDPVQGKVEATNPSLNVFPDYPGTSSRYTQVVPSGLVQAHVKVFPASNPSLCVAEQTFTYKVGDTYDTDLELEFQGTDAYDVVVWSQLLENAEMPPFYDPSNFSKIHIIANNYRGNTNYRDAFRGALRVNATTGAGVRHVVHMRRPMGKFELLTTDLSEFLDRETVARNLPTRASAEDYRVVISFPGYYPNSYSAKTDSRTDATGGVAFETRMTVTGYSEASLGFEYVLLATGPDGGVDVSVDVYRFDGVRVAGSSPFTVPMRRDHHTVLRGAFLSMEGRGGVGIDPGFNGDHNITWH